MTSVLTAVTHRLEAEFVQVLEAAADVTLVRRCADVAELLSAGAAGVARVAVVSPDLRGLDRDALRHLAGHGLRVAGLVAPDDEEGERRLRQLGVATILRPSTTRPAVASALVALAGATTSGCAAGRRPGGRARPDPGRGEADGRAAGGCPHRRPRDADPSDPPSPRRSPSVWGPTGAPGRTTVAVTLAAQLAAAGVRTLLVDLDTWGASVAQVLGLVDEAPGVAAAARASEQGTLDVPGLARLAPEVVPGLRVLTGLPRADRWPELRTAAVEDVLRLARGVADHVVVDTGFAVEDDEELSYDTAAPRRNAATLTALEASDQLVVVGAADPVGLQRLVRAVQDVAVLPSPRPTDRGHQGPRLGRGPPPRARHRVTSCAASPAWMPSASSRGRPTSATRPCWPGARSSRSRRGPTSPWRWPSSPRPSTRAWPRRQRAAAARHPGPVGALWVARRVRPRHRVPLTRPTV